MGIALLGIPLGGWVTVIGYLLLPAAWWYHVRDRERATVIVLVICALLLRLGPSLDPCLHEWDERYHALVAKNLIDHPLEPTLYDDPLTPHGSSWVDAHVWLNKPPLSLWSIAISSYVFGDAVWAIRLPSVLLSGVAWILLFNFARTRFSRTVGFWACFLFAIQGHLVELASGRTSNDHPDTFLMIFVLAGVFAASQMALSYSRRWAVAAGVFMGLAFLSKSWPALLVLPVAGSFFIDKDVYDTKRTMQCIGLLLIGGLCVILPWTIHTNLIFPAETGIASAAHWRHFTVALEGHGRPWTYYWSQIPMIHGELAPIALIWFAVVPLYRTPRKYLAILLWWLIPYIIFSFAVTKMPAYTALSVPAICIILAIAIEHFTRTAGRSFFTRTWMTAFTLALVILPIRFSLDRTCPWEAQNPRYKYPFNSYEDPSHTIITNCPFPIELMFHTDIAAAYHHDLDEPSREKLISTGYRIVPFVGQ